MATRFNFWLSLSTDFRVELNQFVQNGTPPVQFPLISTLHPATIELFQTTYDLDNWERVTKNWAASGRIYQLFSLYANKPDNTQQVKADLDALVAAYPQDFSVSGAWHYADGRPVGMQWSDDDPPVLEGTPWYTTPPQVVNMMPDIVTDPGDPDTDPPIPPTYGPATEVTDVNLLFGQAPRHFV